MSAFASHFSDRESDCIAVVKSGQNSLDCERRDSPFRGSADRLAVASGSRRARLATSHIQSLLILGLGSGHDTVSDKNFTHMR